MSRRRKWSKQELIRNLEILGFLGAPLPPVLPPSPPSSRSSSPAAGSKRKSDAFALQEQYKRPRTGSVSSRHSNQPSVPSSSRVHNTHPAYPPRSDPEDGEVREDAAPSPRLAVAASPAHSTNILNAVPVRRPKRGLPSSATFDQMQEQYYQRGRTLKYSGDARFWSTYPPFHKEYRPLTNPPPPNSPYHQHGGLIARLELIDALVSFTYSLWIKDYGRRTCYADTWVTIASFTGWCKTKWESEGVVTTEAEKAFIGLIYMMEEFIDARKMAYATRMSLEQSMDRILASTQRDVAAAIANAEQQMTSETHPNHLSVKSQATPPMLPSPASIGTTGSANSTPTAREDGTPSSSSGRASSSAATTGDQPQAIGPPVPPKILPKKYAESGLPVPPHVTKAANTVTQVINVQLISNLKDLMTDINAASHCAKVSRESLNLPILARHFPQTFARMVHSTLSPSEEHEPEFEDEEGELYWPGQCISGEGLGWVCLMGQAMIREFGKKYGYRGLEGVVRKPQQIPHDGRGSAPPPGSHSQASSSSRSATHASSSSARPPPAGSSHPSNFGNHGLPPRPNFVQRHR